LTKTATKLKNLQQTITLSTHEQYVRRYFSLDSCSLFLIAKFWQEINKRKKLAWNSCERRVFRKEMFW